MTATVIYKGSLRCEATHLQSGSIIETDAPTDNKGKGERFSPTDLLCISLATCIVTTMGIKAADMDIDLSETKMEVTKHMISDPRRVGKIEITLNFPSTLNLDEKQRIILQRSGDNCPVKKSLHSDVEIVTVLKIKLYSSHTIYPL
jgi:putative redox protein